MPAEELRAKERSTKVLRVTCRQKGRAKTMEAARQATMDAMTLFDSGDKCGDNGACKREKIREKYQLDNACMQKRNFSSVNAAGYTNRKRNGPIRETQS